MFYSKLYNGINLAKQLLDVMVMMKVWSSWLSDLPLPYSNEGLSVNGRLLASGKQLNCKSKNVIYLAQCVLCEPVKENGDINCYVGQTIQPLYERINGHQSCFDVRDELQTWKKSALSKHAYECHQNNFDMKNFKIMAYEQGCATSLNRLESKTINELRLVLGLNRMKIQKE